ALQALRGREASLQALQEAAEKGQLAVNQWLSERGIAGQALAEAGEVDRRLAAGEDLPLAGVPVAVKDTIWVAGRRVTQGSRLFADFHAPADAIAVERLRRAGAVIVGMANT
ncbi:amidase family protein, partial [Acinetobacter baumannii]